jgi:hypothetical protein
MSRRETTLDPRVAAELDRLDAALAGAPAGDAELEALVRDVRALAPAIDPAFRERLGARASEGFPRARQRAWRRRSPRRRWAATGPALAVAASVLVALVVAGVVGRGDPGRDRSAPSAEVQAGPAAGGGATAAPQAADRSATSGSSAMATPAPHEAAPAARRQVERAAELSLSTPADGLQDAADGAVRVTQDLGGYVASSQVATGAGGGTASLRLRVPSARLGDALARLSRLGHVRSLVQSATDITGPVASASDRLRDARAERRGLQRALAGATDPGQVALLRARLRAAARRVSALEAELTGLRRRADLATVDVTLTARRAAPGAASGGWSAGDAGHDALRVLEVSAGVALVALAAAVPLGLVAALALAAARVARRRRREAALELV